MHVSRANKLCVGSASSASPLVSRISLERFGLRQIHGHRGLGGGGLADDELDVDLATHRDAHRCVAMSQTTRSMTPPSVAFGAPASGFTTMRNPSRAAVPVAFTSAGASASASLRFHRTRNGASSFTPVPGGDLHATAPSSSRPHGSAPRETRPWRTGESRPKASPPRRRPAQRPRREPSRGVARGPGAAGAGSGAGVALRSQAESERKGEHEERKREQSERATSHLMKRSGPRPDALPLLHAGGSLPQSSRRRSGA